MKKLLFTLFLLMTISASAQFGGRTGLEIQSLKVGGDETFTNPAAFAGLFYNWQISNRFSLRPEVQYIYSTGNYDLDINNQTNLTELMLSSQVEAGIMFSYRIKQELFISAGTVGTIFVAQTDGEQAFGVKVGAGYTISEKSAIQLNAVIDIQPDVFTDNITKNALKLSYIFLF